MICPSPEQNKITFKCNLCGSSTSIELESLCREGASCSGCRSSARERGLIHALTTELFHQCLLLPCLQERRDIRGIGFTDLDVYAKQLAIKFNYTNTFYNMEPKLDILHVPYIMMNSLDFIICTDVMEHVNQPVQKAFDNLYSMLKSGGVLIISVPHGVSGDTVERFPELNIYKIIDLDGEPVLVNKTKDGRLQVMGNLVFHGDGGFGGVALELRVFSQDAVIDHLKKAGFGNITVYDTADLGCGFYWPQNWSYIFSAQKAS